MIDVVPCPQVVQFKLKSWSIRRAFSGIVSDSRFLKKYLRNSMHMESLWEHLEIKRDLVLKKWCQLILKTYPADAADFLQHETDMFINPVGCIVSQEIKTIYDELLHGMNLERLIDSLTEIIRIRSVQAFSPSQAVGIIFLLKHVVREELAIEIARNCFHAELDFESRIDKVTLLAFDIYMKWRENVCEIRINEMAMQRDSVLKMLARANEISEMDTTR